MDVESLGDVSVSSSVERQAMREQLDAVRHTLNTLASTAAQPGGSGITGVAATSFEAVLSDIASKLSSIEGLYTNLTSKLEKVDVRVEDSERHIKDLQHFSASTIHETARLVDYVGGRATPNTRAASLAGTGPAGPSPSAALRARHMAAAAGVPSTPPPANVAVSPVRTPVASLEYVPGHMGATIQQHAAQIHKLIAGLDFLEAHIIRQDQVVETLQKSVATVAASQSAALETRSPSELSLRMHDLAELVTKLRAHVYKVEKKSGSHEQSLSQLAERIQAVELVAAESGGEGGAAAAGSQRAGPSPVELAAAQNDLREMVLGIGRDVDGLRDQLQAQQQQLAAAAAPAQPGVPAEEGAEMRRQLTYLMSQVPTLVMENAELRQFAARATQQLADLEDRHQRLQQDHQMRLEEHEQMQHVYEQRLQQAEAAAAAAAVAAEAPPAAPLVEEVGVPPQVAELGATVAALQEQVAALEAAVADLPSWDEVQQRVSESVAAAEERAVGVAAAAAPAAAVEGLETSVAALQERLTGLEERVAASASAAAPSAAAPQQPRAEEGADAEEPQVSGVAVIGLASADHDTDEHKDGASRDSGRLVGPVPVDDPAAAVLAAEVAAAARANLEEQFGQLKHRLEMAAVSAAAAEEAARQSAESAAAAVAAAEEQKAAAERSSAAGAAALASLQESVLAMVAGVEQEQAALKQQLAHLAGQVSGEQAAISSGLQAVQEQVAAAAAAATEAAACAQQVQEQQAATSEAAERQTAEVLAGVQAELREQVATVMEQLKERVETGVQQMESQVAALNDQLSGALRADQLEAALADIRAAVADASERTDMSSASLEELRSELILLTGQQDVVASRLSALEEAVGVDPSVGAQRGALQAAREAAEEDEGNEPELREALEAAVAAAAADEQEPAAAVAGGVSVRSRGGGAGGLIRAGSGGGGLLELVAELRARVGGLEGTVEAAAADMDQVRNQLEGNAQEVEDKIQRATSQLLAELEGLSAAVMDMDGRMATTAADCESAAEAVSEQAALTVELESRVEEQAQATSELATRLEEVQARLEAEVIARVQETSAAVSSLSARLARDYINREQLGAIFQARADMKRAVDELATVFNTGRLLRTPSTDNASAAAASTSDDPAPAAVASPTGTLSPRLVSALEDLAGKQAELEHQVKLALYRTEGAVRQEELRGLQQAMMTLEMQFRKMQGGGGSAGSAAVAAPASEPPLPAASGADLTELRARVETLEAALLATAAAAAPVDAAEEPEAEVSAADGWAGPDIQLRLSPEDPSDMDSPVRVRLVVGEARRRAEEDQAAAGEVEAAAEPSLSQMLHLQSASAVASGSPSSSSSPTKADAPLSSSAAAAPGASVPEESSLLLAAQVRDLSMQVEALQSQLAEAAAERSRLAEALAAEAADRSRLEGAVESDLAMEAAERRRMAEALAGELAVEAGERHRLAEALADLQDRLDSQVNATASTSAMIATMATDQHQAQQQVRLTLRVGGPEAEDLAAVASTLATLTARVDAAEEALAAAFVVRTPRSPGSRQVPAALPLTTLDTTADVAALATAEEEASGASEAQAPVEEETHEAGHEQEEDEDSDVLRPALGLMVPVVPREMEQQLASLQDQVTALAAAVGSLGGRVEGLEAADALEDVRAAASQMVLESIPGLVAQQVDGVRDEMAAMVAQQSEPLLEMAGQAARDAAEAVLAVREVAAEAAAAREAAGEAATAAQAAAAEAGECRQAAAEAAREAAEGVRQATEAVKEAAAAQVASVAAVAQQEAAAAAAAAAAEEDEVASTANEDLLQAAIAAAREAAAEAAVSAAREAASETAAQVAEEAAVRVAAAEAARVISEHIAAHPAAYDTESAAALAAAVAEVRAAVTAFGTRVDEADLEAIPGMMALHVGAVREEVAEVRTSLAALASRLDGEIASIPVMVAHQVGMVREEVAALGSRLGADAEAVRDQLDTLSTQVRDIADLGPANLTSAPSSQPPSTPTAAAVASIFTPASTALVLQPPPAQTGAGTAGLTPRAGASPAPSTGGGRATPGAQTSSQQAAFLARMVAAVKGYSNRLHAQYSDAEETGNALAQVDSSLEEVTARFADVRDPTSPAFAEALVMILEQVAALRYIGSQTHPAIQQMVLEHENRLDQLTEQVRAAAAASAGESGSEGPAVAVAAAALDAAVSGRLVQLEAEVGRLAGQQAALDRAVTDILTAAEGLRQQAASAVTATAGEGPAIADVAGTADGSDVADQTASSAPPSAAQAAVTLEMAALSAKVRLLDETMATRLAEAAAAAGRSDVAAAEAAAGDAVALEARVTQLHGAWTALRNRVLAMQEYVDSTQGMIKDMHVAVGGLHRRLDALEGASGSAMGGASGRTSTRVSGAGGPGSTSDAGAAGLVLREVQSEVARLESRLLSLESASLESAHSLAGLKGLAPRVTEAETRLTDACAKLAAVLGSGTAASGAAGASGAALAAIPAPGAGVSLPAVAGAVRALERRVGGRLEAAYLALDSLAAALAAAGRIQAESTANPFKAISAAVKNPVVVAMEEKMESMRATLELAVGNMLEDLRRDQQQQSFESRLGAAGVGGEGGSVRGGGEGASGRSGSMGLRL